MIDKYNPIYSPKYYLEFLNWLNENAVYNITSNDKKVTLTIAMISEDDLPFVAIENCVEECLDKAIDHTGGIIIVATELDLNYDSTS